mmetsp:Transcript_866/g.3131  ORF Transcript_866/g.3131 Transcript_866/m.3131 type:complete len:245 (-) Transcript_866:652-1386(-)
MLRLATAKLPSSCSFDPAPSTYGPRCEPGGPIKYCLVQRRERAAAMSDEFEYGGGEFEGDGKAKVIANQPHDEEIAVSDDEEGSLASSAEDASPMGKGPSPGHGGDSPPDNAGLLMDNDGEHEYDDREIPGSSGGGSPGADGDDGMGMRMGMGGKPAGMDDEDEEEPSEGDRSESDVRRRAARRDFRLAARPPARRTARVARPVHVVRGLSACLPCCRAGGMRTRAITGWRRAGTTPRTTSTWG